MPTDQLLYVLLAAAGLLGAIAFARYFQPPTVKPKSRAPRRPRSTVAPIAGDLLRPNDVSKLLGIPLSTLAAMRYSGKGPEFIQDGKPIYYRRQAIQAWLAKRTVAPPLLPNAFLGDEDPSEVRP